VEFSTVHSLFAMSLRAFLAKQSPVPGKSPEQVGRLLQAVERRSCNDICYVRELWNLCHSWQKGVCQLFRGIDCPQDFLKVRNHVTARRSLPTAKRTRRVSSLPLNAQN
jgi:hypothetical protein